MNRETIADLLASKRLSGMARLTGDVTELTPQRTNARHDWATFDLADDSATIRVSVFPASFAVFRDFLAEGRRIEVVGWIHDTRRDLAIIATSVREAS